MASVSSSDSPSKASRVVVRVVLRDRPGALGAVASRIGALGADISGIEVLECDGRTAIDEFAITLPNIELLSLLRREIEEVDGVLVEHCRIVDEFRDPLRDILGAVERISAAQTARQLHDALVAEVHTVFDLDWIAVLHDGVVVAASTQAPGPDDVPRLADDIAPGVHRCERDALSIVIARVHDEIRAHETSQLEQLTAIAANIHSALKPESR